MSSKCSEGKGAGGGRLFRSDGADRTALSLMPLVWLRIAIGHVIRRPTRSDDPCAKRCSPGRPLSTPRPAHTIPCPHRPLSTPRPAPTIPCPHPTRRPSRRSWTPIADAQTIRCMTPPRCTSRRAGSGTTRCPQGRSSGGDLRLLTSTRCFSSRWGNSMRCDDGAG
eukprot:200196-Chlamydomonas_euryale.AAC.2